MPNRLSSLFRGNFYSALVASSSSISYDHEVHSTSHWFHLNLSALHQIVEKGDKTDYGEGCYLGSLRGVEIRVIMYFSYYLLEREKGFLSFRNEIISSFTLLWSFPLSNSSLVMGIRALTLVIRHFKTSLFRLDTITIDPRLTPVSSKTTKNKTNQTNTIQT